MKPRQEPNETSQSTKPKPIQPPTKDRKRNYPRIGKAMAKKVIPYILVGCIASSAVMMSYTEAREVKAVAGVDDIILLTGLLAMAGIAYASVSEYWTNGQWLEDKDSPVLDPEMAEWGQGFADRIQDQWDNDVLQKAIELGYVDPETGEYIGELEGTGGNTGGDDDNDNDNDDDKNKFPTWQKLKEWVALNNGNIGQALGTGAGLLIGAYASTMLDSSAEGAKMPGALSEDINTLLSHMDDKTKQEGIDLSQYPYNFSLIVIEHHTSLFKVIRHYAKKNLFAYIREEDSMLKYGSHRTECVVQGFSYDRNESRIITDSTYILNERSGGYYVNDINRSITYFGNIPVCRTLEESLAYYDNPYLIYPDKYINPSTIGKSTALAKKLAETGGDLTKSLYKNAVLPTTEQLTQYFEDLNNAENEEEKQKIMDDFVDSLVNPAENPNPNPTPDPDPDPGNPDKPVNPDNPDIPTNNDTFLADLKHLFPFCIPFDLVDCFKLFNAEPVTPRVEFPVHFGIINYDHTFVIDLKDFNNVAVVCRSTFLIIYMTGLILATRALIKG